MLWRGSGEALERLWRSSGEALDGSGEALERLWRGSGEALDIIQENFRRKHQCVSIRENEFLSIFFGSRRVPPLQGGVADMSAGVGLAPFLFSSEQIGAQKHKGRPELPFCLILADSYRKTAVCGCSP